MVTDAYPGELGTTDGTVPIRLMNVQTGREEAIVNVFLSKAGGEFRIDAHPAWDRSGRYVIFNGFLDGTRNVFMADLNGKLDDLKKNPATGK
jgi:Tol biopolymer transport system component